MRSILLSSLSVRFSYSHNATWVFVTRELTVSTRSLVFTYNHSFTNVILKKKRLCNISRNFLIPLNLYETCFSLLSWNICYVQFLFFTLETIMINLSFYQVGVQNLKIPDTSFIDFGKNVHLAFLLCIYKVFTRRIYSDSETPFHLMIIVTV